MNLHLNLTKLQLRTLLAIGSISLFGCSAPVSEQTEQVQTIELDESLSYNYTSFDELVKDSDAAAQVQVTDQAVTSLKDGMSYTSVEMIVSDPILNTTKDETFKTIFTGGFKDETLYMSIPEDPIPEAGEEYLVFLKKNDDETWHVVGGHQGRFLYTDGKVTSLSQLNENADEDKTEIDLDQESYDQVKQRIESAAQS